MNLNSPSEAFVDNLERSRGTAIQKLLKEVTNLPEPFQTRIRDLLSQLRFRPDQFCYCDQRPVSNWIYLFGGFNNSEEEMIAKALLYWRETAAESKARVHCISSMQTQEFAQRSKFFRSTNTPALFLSDAANFHQWIRLDGELLTSIAKAPSDLEPFFNHLHQELLQGQTLENLRKSFATEKYVKLFKQAYAEAKSFISFQVKADISTTK